MHTEFLIIGQGISGTFLSWCLRRANRSFIVIDDGDKHSSSRVASGIINPVTGRRIVKTWMIDELMPFALNSYELLGRELGITAISKKNVIDFFPSPQMLLAFRERIREGSGYISFPENENQFRESFNYDFGFGEISPCYAVNLPELLPAWRKKLINHNQLSDEHFNFPELTVTDKIHYKDITAEKIIFCDGVHSADNNYFKNLPFAFNKGEALIIEANLPTDKVFKKTTSIVPLGSNLFWTGSSYEWNFDNNHPTEQFRDRTLQQLKSWLKVPFKIVDHLASVRPATIERRPFAGIHPHHPAVGILNGMGTKGCSLAPWFAEQLTNQLVNNIPVIPEANINRFRRILN
ncbi:MAG: FAD-binding oxidoreductase [Chitinophagaceae bacterium]|nr:FAD-binding oxidoreductase [Chitinophagaceae bacterium]